MESSVELPDGASILGVEIVGCDQSIENGLSVTLAECTIDDCISVVGVQSVGTGCGYFRTGVFQDIRVRNRVSSYVVEVESGPDASVRFSAVRVFYRLNVGPAPVSASFTDVPKSHPFYQYVEAMKAAGLTNGCGPMSFCVDAPATRGELAKFLATALGLNN
jgi:hypothetical protein